MKDKKIRWGIIGLGKIANKFATDLATIENAQLYAVASRDLERSKDFSAKYKAVKAYDSYDALAKDTQVDAVYIATPHSFHKKHALLCMQHKKAVLCEKPFAMHADEVNEMIATAKENNVLLMEALWTYFLPQYKYVLDIFKTKKYGSLTKLEADFGFKAKYDLSSRLIKKEVGGGSLLDIGIYPIFAALSTLGEPDDIEADAKFFDNGADSECNMIFKYPSATAYLKSTLTADTKTEAIFTFENATVKINTMFHQPSTVSIIKGGHEEVLDFKGTTIGYNYETLHFNELLRTNKKESPMMTFNFSLKLIKLLDKVRKTIGLEY